MPVWDPLMQLTREGKLPEAVYLLIDIIDLKHRSQELACNADFWLAVQEELLPQVAEWAPYQRDPARTLVCGQSFGGLSSLYAGLHWPQSFGGVICQSSSFWWPRRDMYQLAEIPADAGWLLHQVEQGVGKGKLKVFMEAGVHEKWRAGSTIGWRTCCVMPVTGCNTGWWPGTRSFVLAWRPDRRSAGTVGGPILCPLDQANLHCPRSPRWKL